MVGSAHRARRLCIALLSFVPLMAAMPAAAAGIYPPGWNRPQPAAAPVLYDFKPGSLHRGRVPGTPATPTPAAQPQLYRFEPWSDQWQHAP